MLIAVKIMRDKEAAWRWLLCKLEGIVKKYLESKIKYFQMKIKYFDPMFTNRKTV